MKPNISLNIDFSDVIREASRSPLGILALVLVLTATITVVFFKNSSFPEKKRVAGITVVFLAGFALFGMALFRASEEAKRHAVQTINSTGDCAANTIGDGNTVNSCTPTPSQK